MSGREEEDSGGGGRGIFRDFGGGVGVLPGYFARGGWGAVKGVEMVSTPGGSKKVYLEDLYTMEVLKRFAA